MTELDNMADHGTASEINVQAEKEHQSKVAEELLNSVNPDQRACMVLRNIEGLSYQEIADVLKININTVRSRLKRAREIILAQRKEVAQNEL